MACRVWSKFQATRSDGSLVKLRIQDLPENRINDAVDLVMMYFTNEETLHKIAGISQNPKAIAEVQTIRTESMQDPALLNLICCEDTDDEIGQIIGVSSMELVTAGSKPLNEIKIQKRSSAQTEEVQKLVTLFNGISDFYDPIAELNLPCYYDDRGLVVDPKFRHLGIATQFLKSRSQACVAHSVPATCALMTSIHSQKAAEKVNWQTVLEVDIDDLGQKNGVTVEDKKSVGVGKIMVWKQPLGKGV